jgi:hypothetical protein
MQTIQIDGTYTYSDNVKNLKIGDHIKLLSNPSNRMNKDAIGAYTLNGKKIGYVPFKSNQIDINAKYIVSKINLNQSNPILLISMDFPNINMIYCEPSCVIEKKNLNAKQLDIPDDIVNDLKKFTRFLQKSGCDIIKISICEFSDSFLTLCIQTSEFTDFFYTVTKSFYESNIFKYDEFFKFGLIEKCIYLPFQTHRLEKYLEKNYKSVNKICSAKKFKWDNLVKSNISDTFDLTSLSGPNCGMEIIQNNTLISITKSQIPKSLNKTEKNEWIKMLIQYNVKPIEFYNPDNLIQNSQILLDLDAFTNIYTQLEPGGIFYNHKLKAYCFVDLFDRINIVEIIFTDTINKKQFIKLVIKLVITDKQIINAYNPLSGTLYQIEINDRVKFYFYNLISKK